MLFHNALSRFNPLMQIYGPHKTKFIQHSTMKF